MSDTVNAAGARLARTPRVVWAVWAAALIGPLALGCSDSVAPGAGGPPIADAGPDAAPPDAAAEAGPDAAPEAACTPCAIDADCAADAVCHPVGYCFAPCAADDDCPGDFACGAEALCRPPPGVCIGCADDATDDLCDGFDNDCDGEVDEGFAAEVCGVGACASASRCVDGVVEPCVAGSPAPTDEGCDGVDDDCDGAADEDYAPVGCGAGACARQSRCVDGIEDPCVADPSAAAAADVTCDGVDDDCDGTADEDYAAESCGVGQCIAPSRCVEGRVECAPGEPGADDTSCDGVDDDCDGVADEAFAGDETCGQGECVAAAACGDGELVCAPLPPPFPDIDQSCDGLDEDCDGAVDEDCVDNVVGFGLVADAEGRVDVDLVFSQVGVDGSAQAPFFMPRIIELVVVVPPSLTWLGSMTDTVEPGPATLAAGKLLQARADGPGRLRITILSTRNSTRIAPGVIAHLHLAWLGPEGPPYRFAFDERLSALAPAEADEQLILDAIDLGQ